MLFSATKHAVEFNVNGDGNVGYEKFTTNVWHSGCISEMIKDMYIVAIKY